MAWASVLSLTLAACERDTRGTFEGESPTQGAIRLSLSKGHYDLIVERRSEVHDTQTSAGAVGTFESTATSSISYGGITETRGDTVFLLGIAARPYVLPANEGVTLSMGNELIPMRNR
jgi:hypothetical protein